jgi:homoserine O-acetyltransferase
VLVVHALTGDMRAGGPAGWWSPVVGPGKPLDPRRYRVLCFNNLGSCYGSSGPADADFPRRADDRRFPTPRVTGKGAHPLPERELPATITTWDQARSLLLALDALGIQRVHLATGGSVAGMIVLCLAALDPGRFERIAPIAAAEAATPWIQGFSHVARQAILLDPGFPQTAERGLELARQLAHLSYRAEAGLMQRQGRRLAPDEALEAHEAAAGEGAPEARGGPPAAPPWSSRTPYRVQTYLEHQGAKLRRRFHPLCYLAQTDAMDHHDLARPPGPGTPEPAESWPAEAPRRARPRGGPFRGWRTVATPDPDDSWGLARLQARVLAISIDSDQLFFPEHMLWLTERLRVLGVDARHRQLRSAHGHDAFLIEWAPLSRLLTEALALPGPEVTDSAAPVLP